MKWEFQYPFYIRGICHTTYTLAAAIVHIHGTSGTPMRYIFGIYYVYSMYMYSSGICMAYTTYIQWISKFPFHVFMRNSMLHTNAMVEDNVMNVEARKL